MASRLRIPPLLEALCRAVTLPSAFYTLPLLLALSARGQATPNPPERLSYQSYLTDANGTALGTPAPKNYDVIFRIYDASSGGTVKWEEQQTVTVDGGYFSVLLGEGNAVTVGLHGSLAAVFSGSSASDRYVEMTVLGIGTGGADVALAPRLRLLTSPYAFLAGQANSATFATSAGALLNASNDQYLYSVGNNIGIRQANPTTALDVNGTVTANAMTLNGDLTLTGEIRLAYNQDLRAKTSDGTDEIWMSPRTTFTKGLTSIPNSTWFRYGAGGLRITDHEGGLTMFLSGNNRVGIATDAPAAKLHVNGAFRVGGDATVTGDATVEGAVSAASLSVSGAANTAALTANGNIQFGTSTRNVQAVGASTEKLRIVRGTINADGTAATGVGFTSSRHGSASSGLSPSTYYYTINFDPDFTDQPSVVATAIQGSVTSTARMISVINPTRSTCQFVLYDSDGVNTALTFSFIAIGPDTTGR